MKITIDLDKIKDPEKETWLLKSLKLMEVDFLLSKEPQSIEEYNKDLYSGNEDIEEGRFISANDLKIEARKW